MTGAWRTTVLWRIVPFSIGFLVSAFLTRLLW
jgi:hypothetical protein